MLQILLLLQKKEWIIEKWNVAKFEWWCFSSSASTGPHFWRVQTKQQQRNQFSETSTQNQMTQSQSVLHCSEGKPFKIAHTHIYIQGVYRVYVHLSKGSSFVDLIVRVCKSDEAEYPVQDTPSPQSTVSNVM